MNKNFLELKEGVKTKYHEGQICAVNRESLITLIVINTFVIESEAFRITFSQRASEIWLPQNNSLECTGSLH